jgi:hypothetical protein
MIGVSEDKQTILTLVQLFEETETEENAFFYNLGFGNFDLIQLESFDVDKDSYFDVLNQFELKELFQSNSPRLLLYEGQSKVYCQDSIILLDMDVKFIGQQQLNDFEFYLDNKYGVEELEEVDLSGLDHPSIIYSNVIFSEFVMFENLSNFHKSPSFSFSFLRNSQQDYITPSDIYLQNMMFTKNQGGLLPLGFFDHQYNDRIPVWDPRVQSIPKIDLQPKYSRSSHFKYISSLNSSTQLQKNSLQKDR